VGTSFLADLASEGLTAAFLTEITNLADKLDKQIDDMEAANENRDIKTQERVVLGNNLWNTMVKYANIGKSLYEFSDEARYNDYVLTESEGTGGATPETPNS
jgi:glucose-6-phosphate isomerase